MEGGVEADQIGVLSQVGYVIDNTTKTHAIFDISKGLNKDATIDVNTKIAEDGGRVPIHNMIYVADGPSDVPSFSIISTFSGKTFGIHTPGSGEHYDNVAGLQDQGRVNNIGEADYRPGTAADRWPLRALRQIANGVCEARERTLAHYPGAPGDVV